MRNKILSLLVLLLTAATGAWAQGPWTSGDCTLTLSNGTMTVSGNGAMEDYASYTNRPWDNNRSDITSVVVESGVTTVGSQAFYSFNKMTSVTLPEGLTVIGVNAFRFCGKLTSITIPSTVTSIGSNAFYSCASVTDVNLYADPANLTWNDGGYDDFKQGGYTKCHVLAEHLSAYKTKFFGKVNVTFVGDLQPLATSDIEVTTNAASKQDLFTEASFEMPTFDVDVNYTLVRDMQDETNPVAFSGLPSSGNIVVKKGSDGKYQPAEALTIQLIDPLAAAEAQNIIAADGITIKVLVGAENEKGAIDYDQENPITLEAFLADMKPGYYWIKAESTDENSPYDGTVYSQELLLSNGYEITVGAGEYATFYKDENLYTEDENAELYTISSVSDTEAVLSDKLAMVAANTPMLVYNKGTEAKTFILLPSLKEDADEVTVAREFRGTLAEKEMPASSTTVDYYVCTGKAFEWVRDAGVIAANKCWLQIGDQPAAARAMTRSIVGGGDTTNMDDVRWQMEDGNYYDLQGRKVEKPIRGGIYIHNGQKVIVR